MLFIIISLPPAGKYFYINNLFNNIEFLFYSTAYAPLKTYKDLTSVEVFKSDLNRVPAGRRSIWFN